MSIGLMIDWITCVIPFEHNVAIEGGLITSTKEGGEIEYQCRKWKKCVGSFESTVQIKSEDINTIRLSGNPVKFLQGHNIWGTHDLRGLMLETIKKIADVTNTPQPQKVYDAIFAGEYFISRIDINTMFEFDSALQAEQYRYAYQTVARTRTGTAVLKADTVYFGKDSKRWTIKMYNKYNEINSRKNKKYQDFNRLTPSVVNWTLNKMRVEVVLKSNELREKNLHLGSAWERIDINVLFNEYLGRIEMSSQKPQDNILLELSEKPSLLASYSLWKDGHSLKELYKNNKFYSHRRALLDFDIDISVPFPLEQSTAKIVAIENIISPRISTIPEWAIGTDLFFEPRHTISA